MSSAVQPAAAAISAGCGLAAVEPVVGDHPAREHDRRPQHQRAHPATRAGRGGVHADVPLRQLRVDAVVEDERIEPRQDQQDRLDAEEDVQVGAERYRVEEQDAADDHDHEPRLRPRQQAPRHVRHRHVAEDEVDQPEIEQDGKADEQAQRPDVDRFDRSRRRTGTHGARCSTRCSRATRRPRESTSPADVIGHLPMSPSLSPPVALSCSSGFGPFPSRKSRSAARVLAIMPSRP